MPLPAMGEPDTSADTLPSTTMPAPPTGYVNVLVSTVMAGTSASAIGYRLFNYNGTSFRARTNDGVSNPQGNEYAAYIPVLRTNPVFIQWDDGSGTYGHIYPVPLPVEICDCPTKEEIRIEMDTNSTKLTDIHNVTNELSFDATTHNVNAHVDNPTSVTTTAIAAEVVSEMAAYTPGFNINLSQTISHSQTANTLGRILQAMRALGIGKKFTDTTANTRTLWDSDNTTVVQTYSLTPTDGTSYLTETGTAE